MTAVAVIGEFMRDRGFESRGAMSFYRGPMVGPSEWALIASGGTATPKEGPLVCLHVYAGSAEYAAMQREIAQALAKRLRREFADYLPFDRYLVRVTE